MQLQLLGGIGGVEAGEGVRRVAVEENKDDVRRRQELGRLAAAAVREHATGVGRRRAVTDRHRVETRRVLHRRLQVEVLERHQHFLRVIVIPNAGKAKQSLASVCPCVCVCVCVIITRLGLKVKVIDQDQRSMSSAYGRGNAVTRSV